MAARVVVSFEGAIVSEVELSRPVTVVGRHPECDIVIDHPAISLRHALFRVVDHTVYVEDLASTNGTRVNGVAASNQVIHHLDLVQLGMHKLHFFDDAMLAGGVKDLERTVLNEYERTMMATNVPAAPEKPPAMPQAMRPDDGLDQTMAIARNADGSAVPAQTVREAGASRPQYALRAVTGPRKGELTALDHANTMIGTAGGDTALVVRRGRGYFLARLAGRGRIRLNAGELGPGTHAIGENDRIEVGGSTFELIRIGDEKPPGTQT